MIAYAFGNALGSSLAEASRSGVDWSKAPDESAAETARLGRSVTAPVADDSVVGGSGLSFSRDSVASWGRQVNTGIRAAASADASGGWTTAPSGSADSLFPQPQVVASGVDEKGLAWYRYDDGAETHAVANPVIETHELAPEMQGPGLLARGRASMNSYWSDMQDAAVASGLPLSYLAARGMQTLGNVGYSLADMADAVYNNPEQSVAGGLKSIANFGPDAFNSATNLVKTSLNGYSMLAEKLGAGEGTFAGFRGSDAYNITPLFSYDNQAQAGGALLTQVALGVGMAKYGDYGIELNTGAPGTAYSNPMPFRFVAPDASAESLARVEFAEQASWKPASSQGDQLRNHAFNRHPSLATTEDGLISPELYDLRARTNIVSVDSEVHSLGGTKYAAFNQTSGEMTVFSFEGGGGLPAGAPTLHSYYIPLRNEMTKGIPFNSQGQVKLGDIWPK